MAITSTAAVAHRLGPSRLDAYERITTSLDSTSESMTPSGAAGGSGLPNSVNLSETPIDIHQETSTYFAGTARLSADQQGISPELAEVLSVNGLSAYVHAIRQVSVDMHDLARLRPEEIAAVAANLPTPAKCRAWEAVVGSASAALPGTSSPSSLPPPPPSSSSSGDEAVKDDDGTAIKPMKMKLNRTPTEKLLFKGNRHGEGTPRTNKKVPKSFLQRLFLLMPMVELPVPKDHWPLFRTHWIESRAGDPGELRASMLQLYETELLFGALLLGTTVALYTSNAVSEAQLDDFINYRVGTLGFWVVLTGTFACMASIWQLVLAYLAMMLLLPINEANIYTFLRMESTRRAIHMPNLVLVITLGSALTTFSLIIIGRLDGSYLGCALVLLPTAMMMIGVSPQLGYSFNVGMLGGFYGPHPIMPEEELASLSGNELEDRIVEPILRYRQMHGMTDPPADPTFYAAHDAGGTSGGLAFHDISGRGTRDFSSAKSSFEQKRPSLDTQELVAYHP